MSTADDFFIANGPGTNGFQTNGPNTTFGATLEGSEVGLFSVSSDDPLGNIRVLQTGVWAKGDDVGVYGQTRIKGPPHDDFGETAGVFGTSESHPGVTGTSSYSFGVLGQLGSSAAVPWDRAAILGTASRNIAVAAVSDTNPAVVAHSGPPHNLVVGRVGAVTATQSGNGNGVSVVSLKFDAVHAASFGWHGVTGLSSANYGVYGLSFAPARAPGVKLADAPAGVRGQSLNGSIGVLGVADPIASSGAGVAGVGSPDAPAGYFEGDLIVTGQITAGVKDATVPFPDGSKRLLHCMESPEHWFEDFGSARLKRGRATVKLDADFAKVVMLNDYRVFLTPEGDCKGLYVRRHGKSFEVRELQGGTSSVAFSYRIVARRKDIKRHTRFAKMEVPVLLPTRKGRAGRGSKAAARSATRALFAALKKEAHNKRTRATRRRR